MVLSRSGAYVADKVLSAMAAHANDPISGRTHRSSRSAGGSRRSGRAYPSARSRDSRGSRRRAQTPDPLLYKVAHDNSDPLHNHSNIGAMGVYKRDSRPSTSNDQVEMQRQRALKLHGFGRETPPTVRSNTTGSVRSLFDEFDDDHDGVLRTGEVKHLVAAHPQLQARMHELDEDHDGGLTFEEFRHEVDHNGRPVNTGIHPLGKGFAAKGLSCGDPNRLRGAIASKTHDGRDGHHPHPQYKTRTELFDCRRRDDLPDPTFDVDGDGVVSQEDFRASNKFDFNKDGELQDTERHDLRKELVQKTVDRYMSLPHRMKQDEVMPLIEDLTKDLDATVDHPAFLSKLKQLNNASSVSKTFDSNLVHRSIQPYPNLAKAPGTRNDDHNYGIKPSERLRTPTYEIDTYRPYTHRATGVSKRSELFDNRFRDTRDELNERLDSPPDGTLEGVRVDRHKRTSMAPEAKAFGHHHFGLRRTNADTFAHASVATGGHFDQEAHESRPVRIQGRGTHFSLSGPKAAVQEEAKRMEPLSFRYHGLCERRPDNGARIR